MKTGLPCLWLLLLFHLSLNAPLHPQSSNYRIEHLSIEDGLSHGCVHSLLQDSKGFIWIATAVGLNRYDGYTTHTFYHDPENPHSISSNTARVLYEDPADSGKYLWVGTLGGGLNKFDLATEQFYHYQHDPNDPSTLSDISVNCIDKIDSNLYWIGTVNGGLNIFDRKTGRFKSYRHDPNNPSSLSDDYIRHICEDRFGNLWVATDNGLNKCLSSRQNIAAKSRGLDDRGEMQFIRYYHAPNDSTSLPSNFVYTIFEDRQGSFWIGTKRGARIYDRENDHFRRHRFAGGYSKILDHRLIFVIDENASGHLWMGTHEMGSNRNLTENSGLFLINSRRDNFILFRHDPKNPNSFRSNTISSVIQDWSGVTWVGTFCGGVNRVIPVQKPLQHFTPVPEDRSSLSDDYITSLFTDREDTLWIGTLAGGLNMFEIKKKRFTAYRPPYLHRNIYGICGSANGDLWLARGNSLGKFHPKTGKMTVYLGNHWSYLPDIPQVKQKLSAMLKRIIAPQRLIASLREVQDGQQLTRQFRVENPAEVLIIAQGEDSLGTLVDFGWIEKEGATEPVWQMEANQTKHAGGALRNRMQMCTKQLPPGNYTMHYSSSDRHSPAAWIGRPPEMPALWGISLYALAHRERQTIDSLLLPDYHTTNLEVNQNKELEIRRVYEDRAGTVWCLYGFNNDSKQLYQFNEHRRQFTKYEITTDKTISDDIDVIYEDRAGTLWFGTRSNGLVKRIASHEAHPPGPADKFIQYKHDAGNPQSISSNNILNILEDSRGNLWVGTNKGLNKLVVDKGGTGDTREAVTNRKTTFVRYGEKEGLINNYILGILEEDRDTLGSISPQLWIITQKGLSKFDPDREICYNFDGSENLSGHRNQFKRLAKGRAGELYLGGENGLFVYHPDSLTGNPHTPPIVFTGFRLFNQPVLPGENSPLRKSISTARKIRLAHHQDVFSFEFAALDYTNPAQNRYAYQMEGVDPDWVYTDASRRFATYTKLAPGSYTFRVKGSNNDGVWNEEAASIRIIITPPWWKTGWAYAAYLLLSGALLWGVWHFQMSRVRLRHQAEVEHLQAERYQELDRLKSRFFANISHEFRTPLTLILGPLQKLIDQTENPQWRNTFLRMQRSGNRLLRLINQLLDLSKLEAGKMTLRAAPCDLDSTLRPLVMAFESLAGLRDIELRYRGPETPVTLYLDRDKFEKIMTNLLSNAFKFTPEGGRGEVAVAVAVAVAVGSGREDGTLLPTATATATPRLPTEFVEISISDTGSGIAKDRLPFIFDRFYQVDSSATRAHEGSGIGLALSKELVELHRGKISVESEEGEGTTFTVRLPLGSGHLRAEEIAETRRAEGEGQRANREMRRAWSDERGAQESNIQHPASSIQHPVSSIQHPASSILVVEDNPDMRAYICEYLVGDYRIMEAENGAAGFKKATAEMPDLVISDVMMPEMDGFELCRKLKTDQHTSHIPVILLTARADGESRIAGLETGADDYLAKPFAARELQVRVRNLIEQRRKLRERFRREINLPPDESALSSMDAQFLQRAIAIVEAHLSDSDFSVQAFAGEIYMSRVHLNRKLKALTGHTAIDFIRALRLQKAARLLESKTATVIEIAYEVGFKNPSHFAECFRKRFGQTPSRYAGGAKSSSENK